MRFSADARGLASDGGGRDGGCGRVSAMMLAAPSVFGSFHAQSSRSVVESLSAVSSVFRSTLQFSWLFPGPRGVVSTGLPLGPIPRSRTSSVSFLPLVRPCRGRPGANRAGSRANHLGCQQVMQLRSNFDYARTRTCSLASTVIRRSQTSKTSLWRRRRHLCEICLRVALASGVPIERAPKQSVRPVRAEHSAVIISA